MSTYTDLHTRRRENLTILRMPGDPNDGITPLRVILANPENIYEGTFRGKIDSSGATFNNASLNDCAINGGAIFNATIYSDGMEVSIADLTTDISEIAGQLDDALSDIDGLKTISANLAYAIASAESSVETISSSLSSISAYAVSSANAYANGLFDGLSFTMSNLIGDVSARIELSAKEYVDSKIDNGLSVPTLGVYGDTIVNAKYGPSNGTLVAIALNGISAKTAAGIKVEADDSICAIAKKDIALTGNKLLGSFDDGISISTSNGLDSILINGNSILHTLNTLSTALDLKKLDIIVADVLSNKIYDDIANCRYLLDISVSLLYLPNDRKIILSAGNKEYSIPTDDFVKDGMLLSVSCLTDSSGRPYLHFTWNTAASSLTTDVYLDLFVYTASNGIVLSGNDFRLDPLAISSINSAIVVGGHFEPNNHAYASLSAFFAACIGNDPQYVKNNSIYTVFLSNGYALVDIDDGTLLSIGDYDTILVHDHNFGSIVDLSALRYASNVNSNGNVYLFKQGGEGADKSAIEEEARIRLLNDDCISSWISTNFANTGDANVSPVTIAKQDLCALHDISVASNAYVLSDLIVTRSLYVNGALLGITVEKDLSGETLTIARTVADEVEFTTSSADNAPTINITRNAISFSSAPVYVSTSSFIISSDLTKVIDVTSSNVEILTVLSVETDKATITNLCANALSVNEAVIDFRNIKDILSMSSIADLCLALSTSISSLSDSTIESDKVLSTSIDNKIIVDGISAESLSVLHISQEDYYNLVSTDSTISNVLYIVSSDYVNVYGQLIKNVALPTDLSDAATKGYVDSAVSSIHIPIDLSAFTNSPGYLVSNDISNIYKKSETSSAIELSNALSSLASQKWTTENFLLKGSYVTSSDTLLLSSDNDLTLSFGNLGGKLIIFHRDGYVEISGQDNRISFGAGTYNDFSNGAFISIVDESSFIGVPSFNCIKVRNATTGNILSNLGDVLSTKLEQDDVNISYSNLKIWLSSKMHVTSVDCTDFIKDGMLSTVELCGTTLVLNFNTDAGSDPISVELSNFVDNYDDKISSLSDAIDNKVFVSNNISGISGYSDLSVIKLSADEYASLLTSDALLSNALYVVENDYIDAYGQLMKNLAAPSDLSDAATKGYVDNVSGDVQSIVSTIYNSLTSIDSISSFNANSNLSVAINAIVTIRDILSSLRSSLSNIA